jgi:large subunit ribosomal protein L24
MSGLKMKSIRPGKQRKELFNAPLHKKRKWIASHLEENLLLKYDRRSIPVVKGDTVKVMRGSFKGHEDKIAHVNIKKRYVEIEGLTMTKADGKKIAKPLHASNLLITKLNLTDKWRRKKLEKGLSEDAKKEVEKEAEEQIKEAEEVQKRKVEEEEKERAKEEAAAEETVEPVAEKTEEIKEPKPEEKVEEKPAPETKKPKAKAEKKAVEEKKTPAKKTPTKTKKEKEEEK